jgi:hypothetical protein
MRCGQPNSIRFLVYPIHVFVLESIGIRYIRIEYLCIEISIPLTLARISHPPDTTRHQRQHVSLDTASADAASHRPLFLKRLPPSRRLPS